MSTRNTDFEFGEEFNLNFDLVVKTTKRVAQSPPKEPFKRFKTVPPPKNVVKRKFPGPAGILPDRRDSGALNTSSEKDPEEIPCSQMSVSVFHSSPWVDMTRDYEPLLEQYDIKWIKANAAVNKLLNRRAPFLGAIIQSIECFEGKNPIIKVVLKDVSGEIHGTIMQSLYEEHSSCLVVGSVIVLRQCGVLTTTSNQNHYLTIIPKNLVRVYWKDKDQMKVIKVQDVSLEDLSGNFKGLKESRRKIEERNNEESSQIDVQVQNVLEGIDMDLLFGDF